MASYSIYTDRELLAFLKTEDQLALKELITRYWQRLLAVALNRINNQEEAEECVQDVFFNLWKKRQAIDLKYSLLTYLSVAVKYQVLDLLDKKHRRLTFVSVSDAGEDFERLMPSAEDSLLEKELFAQLEKSILRLPEKCQVVYRMSREEGKNNKKIASELDISEKTVEAHLSKAIRSIRSDMISSCLPLIGLWMVDKIRNLF